MTFRPGETHEPLVTASRRFEVEDLASDNEARLDYRLVRAVGDRLRADTYYPYHLRQTLNEVALKPLEDLIPLKTPLTFRYKNRFGDRFESTMVLYSHPLVRQYPEIQQLRTRRLAADEIDPPELPSPESTTHENSTPLPSPE